MTDELTLKASKCPHGVWHSHNARALDDGSVVATEPCDGGRVAVDGRVFGVSGLLAVALVDLEEQVGVEGLDE